MSGEMRIPGFPPKQGLYDPALEKDSCGIGFIANIKGVKSHDIVRKGLQVLNNLFHRGAQGCDPCTGDGAGILLQVPHEFFTRACADVGVKLPNAGEYGVGMVFLPPNAAQRKPCERLFEKVIEEEGVRLLGWRDVPVKSGAIGSQARCTEPAIRQVFIARDILNEAQFERKLYVIRKCIENAIRESAIEGREYFYLPSMSMYSIIYKGLLLPDQITQYYPDLTDTSVVSALAMIHSRFSTNTFPTWPLAHPYRYICHNGEINTLKGNVNWMRARQGRLQSELFGDDIPKLFPIVYEHQSDSACIDNALEFLVMGGRSLAHAMMMLIPEPWVGNPQMDLDRRGFYEYHAAMMEPWDGPAAVCFTDGKQIGATLDRNGLRPCRYQVTTDDLAVLASEAGVLPYDAPPAPAGLRLHGGRAEDGHHADGHGGRRAGLLHGHRHAAGRAVGAAAAPLQVLQAALRAGDQSPDRSDPRRAGHVAGHQHRPQAKRDGGNPGGLPAHQGAAAHPDERRSREDPPDRRPALQGQDSAPAVPRGGRAGRPGRGGGRPLPASLAGDQGRVQVPDSERPGRERGVGADPEPARHLGAPPPPRPRVQQDRSRPDP